MNKINKKITIAFLFFTLIFRNQNAKEIKKANETNVIKNDIIKTEKTSTINRKLTCPEMDLLNSLLVLKPVNVLRMKSSFKTAKEILKNFDGKQNNTKEKNNQLEKEELVIVLDYKDKLLKPVKNFFDSLYDYQSLLKPLVVQILVGDEKNAKTNSDNFLFLEFFEMPKEKALTFFEDTLISKEMLLKTCKEFETLFGVVTSNLSEEVIRKEKELLQKIKAKKTSSKTK